jgi:hypothetical protein
MAECGLRGNHQAWFSKAEWHASYVGCCADKDDLLLGCRPRVRVAALPGQARSACAGVLLHPALAVAEDGGAEWNLEAGPTAMSLMERGISVASPS